MQQSKRELMSASSFWGHLRIFLQRSWRVADVRSRGRFLKWSYTAWGSMPASSERFESEWLQAGFGKHELRAQVSTLWHLCGTEFLFLSPAVWTTPTHPMGRGMGFSTAPTAYAQQTRASFLIRESEKEAREFQILLTLIIGCCLFTAGAFMERSLILRFRRHDPQLKRRPRNSKNKRRQRRFQKMRRIKGEI